MIASIFKFNTCIIKGGLSIFRLLTMIFVFGLPVNALSQIVTKYDSIDIASNMLYNQRVPEAINILTILDRTYPLDENIMKLYSNALYWNNDFSRTIAYIKHNTIKKNYPENLNYHFGKILFELNYLQDSDRYLSIYLDTNPHDAETLLMLAKIAYWQGKPSKEILNKIQIILNNDPDNADALELKEEVLLLYAPELSLTGGYVEDSQPLKSYITSAILKYYYHSWLQPSLQINSHKFVSGEQVLIPTISNKTFLPKSKTQLNLKAGMFSNTWSEDKIATWSIGLLQRTIKNIDISAEASRTPYLYTLASIAENVVPTVLSTSVARESGNGVIGKITAQQWQFKDDNKVNTLSAWLLMPIIKHTIFTVNMGYAFTVADSEQNRFVLDESVKMPGHVTYGQVLPGVFNPYFTPQNQVIHAALAKIDMKFNQKLSASINSNIGVYASIDNPNYVYYGTSSPPIPNADQRNPNWSPPTDREIVSDYIYKIYVPTRYLPLDLRGKLIMEVNRVLSIYAEYAYVETIFFQSQEINMGLKWKLASR